MSHLDLPRIVFTGRFISDVSTINNDDSNYDLHATPSDLGWNPQGSAIFDLYDCRVTGGASQHEATSDSDPVVGLVVSGTIDRSSAKMVDLDPDWQMSSQIWGLSVRIYDSETQQLAVQGDFKVAAFRDLFIRQLPEFLANNVPNQQPAGGRYISVLSNVKWGAVSDRSPLLADLKSVSPGDLAIALNFFGYYYSNVDGRHTTGTVFGCIGPRRSKEPQSFVTGRRLQSLAIPIPGNPPTRATLIGPADALIDADGNATIDLGHALPISDSDGSLSDISKIGSALSEMKALILAVLPSENKQSGDRVDADSVLEVGEITYLIPGWYRRTGGLSTFRLKADARRLVGSRPLALLARMADGSSIVLNRETRDGLFVRADNFVQRLDPGDAAQISLVAVRYGQPLSNQPLYFALAQSGNNDPAGAISFSQTVTTDNNGRGLLQIKAADPGTPRQAIDGQVYAVGYSLRTDSNGQPDYAGSGLNAAFDVVVAHIRSGFVVPDKPEWFRDIYPIMAPYAQLYPIMSRHLFSLNDYDSVAKHRRLMLLAFERSIEDSNYMPVTRDLSRNKRLTLIRWLSNETGDPSEPLSKGSPSSVPVVLPVKRVSPLARQVRAIGEEDMKRGMAIFFGRETQSVLEDTHKQDKKP